MLHCDVVIRLRHEGSVERARRLTPASVFYRYRSMVALRAASIQESALAST